MLLYYGHLLQTKAYIEKIFETSTILQIAGIRILAYIFQVVGILGLGLNVERWNIDVTILVLDFVLAQKVAVSNSLSYYMASTPLIQMHYRGNLHWIRASRFVQSIGDFVRRRWTRKREGLELLIAFQAIPGFITINRFFPRHVGGRICCSCSLCR